MESIPYLKKWFAMLNPNVKRAIQIKYDCKKCGVRYSDYPDDYVLLTKCGYCGGPLIHLQQDSVVICS